MNTETIAAEEFEKPSTRRPRPRREVAALVEEAIALRKSVGDGLNDTEFTQLLLRKFSREADGFAILSPGLFEDSFVYHARQPHRVVRAEFSVASGR